MKRIMFVCHGNICRSPMAEFVFKKMVADAGLSDKFVIQSSATSYEEIGNPVHYGTKNKLADAGISCLGKVAVRLTKSDYADFDLIIGMDDTNIREIMRIFGSDSECKVCKLLDFDCGGSIADPWYTGDFDRTYDDVVRGCRALLANLTEF